MSKSEYGRPPTRKGEAGNVFPFNRKLLRPRPLAIFIQRVSEPDLGWDFNTYLLNTLASGGEEAGEHDEPQA